MKPIQIFIISWNGQHEKAVGIGGNLTKEFKNVTIVYSDPDINLQLNTDCNLIRRSNELLWGDKFTACLDAFDSDLMLVIHADCACDDWPDLARKCVSTMSQIDSIDVWAPCISGTPYEINITRLGGIENTSLDIVVETDGLVFCLSKQAVKRMRKADLSRNLIGWGINGMFCAHAFASNKLVVVDRSIKVGHAPGTGYDSTDAWTQRTEFLKQLEPHEWIQAKLLRSYIDLSRIRERVTTHSNPAKRS